MTLGAQIKCVAIAGDLPVAPAVAFPTFDHLAQVFSLNNYASPSRTSFRDIVGRWRRGISKTTTTETRCVRDKAYKQDVGRF